MSKNTIFLRQIYQLLLNLKIKKGEVTRTDHEGIGYPVNGPLSTDGTNEVIIKPTKTNKKKN